MTSSRNRDTLPSTSDDDASTVAETTPLLPARRTSSDASSQTLGGPQTPPEAQLLLPGDGGENGNPVADEKPLGIGRLRGACIIFSVWVLVFLQAINMSGMTMSQSTIAADLNAYENAMWFTSSYLIAMSSLAPLAGRLAGSVFTPRAMVAGASGFFGAGGALTAGANSFATLITGRVISGVGAAGIMTLAIILVIQLASDKKRGLFVGLVNLGFTVGLSLGAVVFGAAVPVIGWRALFWIQVPLGLLAGLGVFLSLPSSLQTNRGPKDLRPLSEKLKGIDYLGAVTLTLTLVLFLTGMSGEIQPLLIFLSFISLAVFIATEYLIAADPIIPLQILQSRGMLLSCMAQLGFMASRWTILFYTPIFALAVRGLSPAVAGSILIPTNAGFGSGGLLVGALHIRRTGSFWLPSLVSLGCFALTLFFIGQNSTQFVPAPLYVGLVFLNGLSTGAAINYTLHHLLHLVAPETHYVATSLIGTFRGFAGSFGAAIGGGIFARALRGSLDEGFSHFNDGVDRSRMVTRLIGSPAAVFHDGLTSAEQVVAVRGYEDALRMVFTAAVGLAILVILIQAGTGWKGAVSVEEEDEAEVREAIAGRGVEGD